MTTLLSSTLLSQTVAVSPSADVSPAPPKVSSVQPSSRWRSRAILLGILTSLTVLSGLVPQLSLQPQAWQLRLSGTVQAQSDELIVRYAQAAYEMEQSRRLDYAAVKRMMGGVVPEDVCDRGNLSPQVQSICGRFSERYDAILRKHRLTRSEFNAVHRRANDPSVQQRIQKELLRIQTLQAR